MSWDEVKKAINSDLNVPLNERMTWVSGIIPRGQIIKTSSVNRKSDESPSWSGDLVNVTVKGMLAGSAFISSSWNNLSSASMTINIDSGKRVINLGSSNTEMKIDTDALGSTFSINENPLNLSGGAHIYNDVIRFEESLKVSASVKGYYNYPSTASVSYVLCD